MDGFYLMHRGWRDNPVFAGEKFSRADAWVWMIEAAKFKDTPVGIAGRTVTIGRGQLSHSLRFLASKWGWDEAKVRRFLARLSREEMIRSVTDAGQTVITICNYEKYQSVDCVADAATDAASTQHRRGADAKKKEGNEGNEDPETGVSGAKAPDDEPDDLKSRIFGKALEWLMKAASLPEPKARTMLGKWCRDFGDGRTLEVLQEAYRCAPVDPVPYITRLLENPREKSGRRTQGDRKAAFLDGAARVFDERQPSSAGGGRVHCERMDAAGDDQSGRGQNDTGSDRGARDRPDAGGPSGREGASDALGDELPDGGHAGEGLGDASGGLHSRPVGRSGGHRHGVLHRLAEDAEVLAYDLGISGDDGLEVAQAEGGPGAVTCAGTGGGEPSAEWNGDDGLVEGGDQIGTPVFNESRRLWA